MRGKHRRPSKSALALFIAIIATLILGTATVATATQSPANCNENDFILQMKQDPGPPFTVGQTINYSVRTGNEVGLTGCDIDNVLVTLTDPHGNVTTLQTGGVYPFTTPTAQIGPVVPYVVSASDFIAGVCGNPLTCPIVRAKAHAEGILHDNPAADDTFKVDKELSGPVTQATPLNFLCYEANRQPIAPGVVTVTDQFGTFNPKLVELHKLCNPANKNNEDPTAPTNPIHLDGYEAGSKGNPAQGHKIEVTDQFGTITETLQQVKTVFVPAAKSLVGPVGPLAPNLIDHYVCYAVKTTNIVNPTVASLVDEFGTLTNVKLDGIAEFCDPASVNGSIINTPTGHLNCWTVNLPSGAFKAPANIWINDEFQARKLKLDNHVWELCEPAIKKVLS